MIEAINIISYPAIFILGLMIGSFLNVCIYRIPRKESIVFPDSHCPKCGQEIRKLDNIPLISFLFLKGKCRYCGERISLRYPLVELATAVLLLLLLYRYGLTLDFMAFGFFACVLIVISAIDFEHMLIPNMIIIPSIITGLFIVLVIDYHTFGESLLGFLVGGGVLLLIALVAPYFLKQEGLGGGDIKLAAFIGIFLGRYVLIALFCSFFIGGLVGVAVLLAKRKNLKDPLTFGPFLSSGALITLFFGIQLWTSYLNLVGLK